jgi:NifU-like protein involved in Fe-S cluster formation
MSDYWSSQATRKKCAHYSKQVNVGTLENPDAVYTYTGPCGDTIKLYLQIGEDNVVQKARFQYIGCPTSAASGSILTQIIIGKTIQDAKAITSTSVLSQLGGLPDEECHCAELVVTTLQNTIAHYQQND